MEEAPENGNESSHSAHADGMNEFWGPPDGGVPCLAQILSKVYILNPHN